jgi:hypothetical protein
MRKFEIKTTADFTDFINYVYSDLYNYIERNLNFKAFDVTIEEHKVKRTNRQNDYYWANAEDIAKVLNKNGCFIVRMGTQYEWEKGDVDKVNKKEFCTESTKKLSTKEFGDLMETVFAYWIAKTKGKWQPKESIEEYYNNK